MSDLKTHLAKSFPLTEEFVDCCGVTRTFIFTVRELLYSFAVEAREKTTSPYCYRFAAIAATDPFDALGKLRGTIRKALSQKYLLFDRGEAHMAHDEIKGVIDSQGLVVDGTLLGWEDLKRILLTHEGFAIRLQIADPHDS